MPSLKLCESKLILLTLFNQFHLGHLQQYCPYGRSNHVDYLRRLLVLARGLCLFKLAGTLSSAARGIDVSRNRLVIIYKEATRTAIIFERKEGQKARERQKRLPIACFTGQ